MSSIFNSFGDRGVLCASQPLLNCAVQFTPLGSKSGQVLDKLTRHRLSSVSQAPLLLKGFPFLPPLIFSNPFVTSLVWLLIVSYLHWILCPFYPCAEFPLFRSKGVCPLSRVSLSALNIYDLTKRKPAHDLDYDTDLTDRLYHVCLRLDSRDRKS